MFFEMRFDLGTLDLGERSLPFGLLVSVIRFPAFKQFYQLLVIHNFIALTKQPSFVYRLAFRVITFSLTSVYMSICLLFSRL